MEKLKRNLVSQERHKQLLAQRSKAERHLWRWLRRNYLGFRFRKQYRLGPYCLDFYCPQANLCIEIDGDWHEERVEQDRRRDEVLAANGILTVRYAADSVFLASGSILYQIGELCKQRVEAGLGRDVSVRREFGYEHRHEAGQSSARKEPNSPVSSASPPPEAGWRDREGVSASHEAPQEMAELFIGSVVPSGPPPCPSTLLQGEGTLHQNVEVVPSAPPTPLNREAGPR